MDAHEHDNEPIIHRIGPDDLQAHRDAGDQVCHGTTQWVEGGLLMTLNFNGGQAVATLLFDPSEVTASMLGNVIACLSPTYKRMIADAAREYAREEGD